MDVDHHAVQLAVHLLGGPDQALGVLGHLQGGDAHAAGVDGLGGGHDHAGLGHQVGQRVVGGGHVGDLDVVLHAVGDDLLGAVHAHVVLHGGGHDDVGLDAPGLLAGEEGHVELIGVVLHLVAAGGAHLEHVIDLFLAGGHALGIVDVAVGAGQGHDLRAQMQGLLADAPGHVAEAGDRDGLALDLLALVLEDLLQVVHGAIAGGLGAGQGAAVAEALAGEHAVLPHALQAAVLAEEEADLAAAHAHIAGGHVHIRPDIAIQRGHEALAEAHDLRVGLAGGIEVGAALGAADGQAGQAVLEGLLKAQELDDAGVDVRLEAQAALVGADGAVELAAVAGVGVVLALVVHPAHAEGEHALGLHDAAQQVRLLVLRVLVDHGRQGGQDLLHGLHEFRLAGMLLLDVVNDTFHISVHNSFSILFNLPRRAGKLWQHYTIKIQKLFTKKRSRIGEKCSDSNILIQKYRLKLRFFQVFCAITASAADPEARGRMQDFGRVPSKPAQKNCAVPYGAPDELPAMRA